VWYNLSKNKKNKFNENIKTSINTQYPQESLFFEPWHEGSIIKDEQGNPKTLYHGTLTPFEKFDLEKLAPTASFGAGIYTTENPEDASLNYANPDSPDWQAKINVLSDDLKSDYDNNYLSDESDEENEKRIENNEDKAMARAIQQIKGNAKPNIIPLYGKMHNPAYVSRKNMQQMFEMYHYDENLEEFEPGEGEAIIEEIIELLHEYDYPEYEINFKIQQIRDHLGAEFNLYDLYESLNNLYLFDYVNNSDNFFRDLLKKLNYDGIIINAEEFWPNLVNKPTKHYIFFDPKQIKSPYNRTFDPKSDILNANTKSWYKLAKASRDEYLNSLGVSEEIIAYLNSLPDKEANPMLSSINKNPKITLEELKKLHPKKEESEFAKNQRKITDRLKNFFSRDYDFHFVFTDWLIKNLLKIHRNDKNLDWVHHILNNNVTFTDIHDYYNAIRQQNPNFNINTYSLEQIQQLSNAWHETITEKGVGNEYLPLKPSNIIHTFKNGWKLVNVDNEHDLDVEGSKDKMNHCVGSYADNVNTNYTKILSLRDTSNKPHVTIEISPDFRTVRQIKGKSNSEPKQEYKKLLSEYFSNTETSYQEAEPIIDKIEDLRFAYDENYDNELNEILNPKLDENNRDEYGFKISKSKNDHFPEVVDAVAGHVTDQNFIKRYQSDIAQTLATYAGKKDIEYLKSLEEKNEFIYQRFWIFKSELQNLQQKAFDIFDDFYEDWYYEPYTPEPKEDEYETPEEYQKAYNKYEEEWQEEEVYAMKDCISNSKKYNFWNEILDFVNKELAEPEYKNLVTKVVLPEQTQSQQIIQAFNLKKYFQKQAMIKLANEYWFHDGDTEFADGDIGDKNHEMIAEDYILNHFIPNAPEHLYDYGLSKSALNECAPDDVEFIEYLMNKYKYSEEDAIDDAYSGNYIRWLVTGNDESESPIIQELFHALKDPRKYAVEKLGWIRVQGRFIETYNLDDNHLDEITNGLREVYGNDAENMSWNVEVHAPSKYFNDVPFHELEDGSIRKRIKEISDEPEISRPYLGNVPGYKYPGG
jgi:PcfJ-like protein/ADP-Ribosyltransferase in polyvalent proteins